MVSLMAVNIIVNYCFFHALTVRCVSAVCVACVLMKVVKAKKRPLAFINLNAQFEHNKNNKRNKNRYRKKARYRRTQYVFIGVGEGA